MADDRRSTVAILTHAVRASGVAPAQSLAAQSFIVAACFGIATLVRYLIGLAAPDVIPFATYFPAIAIAALLGGFWAGVCTWLLSIAAGIGLFMEISAPPYLTLSQGISVALFSASSAIELLIASWLRDLVWLSLKEQNRYRALVDALPMQVVVFGADGRVSQRQPVWEHLTGETWPAYRGRSWLDRVHEEDRAKLSASGPEEVRAEARVWSAPHKDWRWFDVHVLPLRDLDGRIEGDVAAFADITDRKMGEERRELLLYDMRHRLKNFIAVIHAIVTASTPRGNRDVERFADIFMRRVRTLQSAADLVMKANAAPVDLAEVVPAALAPFGVDGQARIAIDGPSLLLKEHTVGGIALACHELATNAAKYGALSVDGGKVTIKWEATPDGDGERVLLEWREKDGPPVNPPTRAGFGTRIIKAAVARETNGDVTLDYKSDGLICRMTFVQTKPTAPGAASEPDTAAAAQ